MVENGTTEVRSSEKGEEKGGKKEKKVGKVRRRLRVDGVEEW